ncbi:transglutaminase-like cysteine peptidase [Dongia sp.]|uniref:transglutaminase-like cysteine peptidase n=1 Tax=Dongia sp. TaxID=1977262 RepID=UPI003753BF3B
MANSIRYNRIAACFGLVLGALLAFAAPADAVPTSQFPVYAIDDYPFPKAPALMRWRSVQQREAELMARANPDDCKAGEPRLACAAKEALLLEEKLQDLSPVEQVEAVYAYFNAVKWKEHAPDCGVDCWKTRLDFLADREGDCGDHALAEYFTLKRLGFKERDLQLIVAQLPGFADSFKGGHVVLRVRAEGEYFILDNRRSDLADLSGLGKYKVLAGVNADSVQIYNLVTPTPPPGYVADATQVAALITSPGAAQQPIEDVQVAEATPETFATQSQPILVASAAPAEAEPAASPASASATFEDDSDMACMQSANLADWNPFLPCTPTKQMKIVVKPKIIIGAEPPKSLEPAPIVVASVATPSKPEIAAPKAVEPKFENPKIVAKTVIGAEPPASQPTAEKPKIVAKTIIGAEPPKAVAQPVAEAEEANTSGACMQGATLADWNPDLPCAADGNASTLRIENKD